MFKRLIWLLIFSLIWIADLNLCTADQERLYKGKTFSEWVSQIDAEIPIQVGHEPEYVQAIHYFGTNEIPTLIGWIKSDSTALEAKKLAEMEQAIEKETNLPAMGPATYRSSFRAELVFGILGAEARPAIPALTQIAMNSNDSVQFEASIRSLANIGADSLPSYITILTNAPPDARYEAISYLPVFHTDAVVALSAVIKCLEGNNDKIGDEAVNYLSRSDLPHSILIPALTNELATASVATRLRILRCFYFMEPPLTPSPREAVPALLAAMQDTNTYISNLASNALLKIAPEYMSNSVPFR